MRADSQGNLYVSRNGAGKVVAFSPAGNIIQTIPTSFTFNANLEFGGVDGKTLYTVGRCGINTRKDYALISF